MEEKKHKKLKVVGLILLVLGILGISAILGVDYYVKVRTEDRIVNIEDLDDGEVYEGILILGAGLVGDKPSPMLKERLDKGIELYKRGIAPLIVMSGDHQRDTHDEVNVMKQYAIDNGVPSNDIFMDHAGVSTYDSVYRTKEVFDLKRIAIVTQGYHLYRALYIADSLGLTSVGVDARTKNYSGQLKRDIREILARDKDFVKCMFKPSSLYVSESIPVSGGGNVTNDKPYISIREMGNDREHFISNRDLVERIETSLETGWTTEKCDGVANYTLELKDGRTYGVEVYESTIHITDKGREIVLDEEVSKPLHEILES